MSKFEITSKERFLKRGRDFKIEEVGGDEGLKRSDQWDAIQQTRMSYRNPFSFGL
jgi:hypothetical protein